MKILIKLTLFFVVIGFSTYGFAQTTGKIAGTVFDGETQEPLIGANVFIEDTHLGASVDLEGFFFILNVSPGTYTVSIEMIGYKSQKVENVRVSVNRTTNIDVALEQGLIESETIVVQADKASTKKDLTSSMRTVSAAQMEVLPVNDLQGVINMQAGVVNGRFRGGRATEVSYMVDGLQVDESFSGDGKTVDLEIASIEDLEVITGTFNAEYGRAMSGVVNAVTKDGGDEMDISFSAYTGMYLTGNATSSYQTSNDDIFIGLGGDEFDPLRNKEFNGSISGPVIPSKLYYFVNTRYQDNKNHLNGYRKFNPDDFTFYANPELWPLAHQVLTVATGDEEFVPMNDALNFSLLAKLTYQLSTSLKTSVLYTRNDDEWNDYNHTYKYNPDGVPTAHRETDMYSFRINHTLNPSMFYQANFSFIDNRGGYYLFNNPESDQYVHDGYAQGNDDIGIGFLTGGQMKNNDHRHSKDYNAKLDFTWQINKNHNIKSGVLYTQHYLKNEQGSVRNFFFDFGGADPDTVYINENNRVEFPNYQSYLPGNETIYADRYTVWPYEFAAYIQDKMEHEEMVINFGLRVDYFNPNTVYPTDRRNPDNNPQLSPTEYKDADEKIQISPRLGLAYQLADRATLRFSYGHFFQMPPFYAMFQNNSFFLSPNDYQTTMGNAQLNAQKTIQYEIGLWQQLNDFFSFEVALYYRDIYDLLSTKVVTTYNQVEYGLYTNKDYGNTKGLEVKLDYEMGSLRAYLNYTLQFTRGNADNPTQTFDRAGNNTDPVNRLIVMSWDQRHTLNATFGYYQPAWGTTLTGYYNSGSPYSYSPAVVSNLIDINLPPNNDSRPARFSIDLSAFYRWQVFDDYTVQLYLNVYNLLDELNENSVYGRSGRAYTNVIDDLEAELLKHQNDFNDYFDRVRNPSQYDAPRYVKVGLGLHF